MKNRIIISLALFMIFGLMSCGKTSDYELIPVKSSDKWGYVNHEGKYVINPQFFEAMAFSDGMALVCNGPQTYGYINEKGELVIDYKYVEATQFKNGLAFVVEKDGVPTCIDKNGNVVFSLPDNLWCSGFEDDGLSSTMDWEGKIMFLNSKGNAVLSLDSVSIVSSFVDGVAFFRDRNGTFGLVDNEGRIISKPQFANVHLFNPKIRKRFIF